MKAVAPLDRLTTASARTYQTGVTLVELVITIVVVGIALSALISALTTGISNSTTPLWESKALALSQAYLDEISAMRFDDQTPVGGGEVAAAVSPCAASTEGQTRANFDDVDDYNGVSDAPPILIDTTINMVEYASYQVDVLVVCAGTELGLSNNNLAKRITVTVQTPTGDSRSVAIYKGNF